MAKFASPTDRPNSNDPVRSNWPTGSPIAALKSRPRGFEFRAEIDTSELNEKGFPGTAWACKSIMLSKSMLAFMSRRMIHVGKQVVIAIHRIDDEPVSLMGRVIECEYHADGQHVVLMELVPISEPEVLNQWTRERARNRPKA